jgi:hypothetical protein
VFMCLVLTPVLGGGGWGGGAAQPGLVTRREGW